MAQMVAWKLHLKLSEYHKPSKRPAVMCKRDIEPHRTHSEHQPSVRVFGKPIYL